MSLAGAGAGFLAEQRARAAERAARFAREAANPPPPLPVHRKTVSGGKVSKPKSQFDVLSAFIRRKLVANMPIDAMVQAKARAIGVNMEQLAREVEQAPVSPAPTFVHTSTSRARGTASSLDADLDEWWKTSPTLACRDPERAQPRWPSTPSASSQSDEVVPESCPSSATSAGEPSAFITRRRRSDPSKRWRLRYLMLVRKASLSTSTCRAFFFRSRSRRAGRPAV